MWLPFRWGREVLGRRGKRDLFRISSGEHGHEVRKDPGDVCYGLFKL